jgi:hypothetical protein
MDKNTCIDIACYTFDGTKVFAVQSDKIGSFDFSKKKSVLFQIRNPGLSGNTLFFDMGFRSIGSPYFMLNQKFLTVTPNPGTLPAYARNDVIVVPDVKIQIE